MDFTNIDFINLRQSVIEMQRALASASLQQPTHQDSQNGPKVTVEEAEGKFKADLLKILRSPLAKAKPLPYGDLPLKAVLPARKLYGSILSFQQQEGDDDSEIEKCVEAFVAAIDTQHPFLSREQRESEGEIPGDGQGPSGASELGDAGNQGGTGNGGGDSVVHPETSATTGNKKAKSQAN